MLKNKLQEVAQRNYRSLPIYTSTKEGPDHAPRFRASVTYNGHTYHSPAFCTSIKQAEIAAAEAALHALSHNSNLANGPLTAQMEPVEVPSNSQNESKKVQKGDRKEEPSQQPDVLPISESGMANVLENSELKTETSKIAQASPLSFSSSRIQVVPLQGFSISATSGKGTEKLNTGNISSVYEISGNETNKEQAHKMAAGMLEERHRIEEVIQQSEGRIYSPQFMSVKMRPVEVPSNLQKESNEEQEGDKKEATLQQPEDVLAKVLPDSELSELKSDTSQIAQAPPLSFYSSRIHAVPPQAFSISEKSGKGTDNISSMPETSSNKANKGQTCNMAAGMLEERQCNEVVIQQSEGRPSTPHSMSDMHKNQLQDFATRGGFDLPCYSSIREGLPHAPRFKAAVKFNGETFESPGFFNTLRQAEHAAATVALKSLSEKGSSLDESSMYKSLLQEKAQKEGKPLPVYNTTRSGPSHMPDFKCTVKFDGMTFEGKYAKTKKQAEKNAASILWSALKDCRRSFISAQQTHDDKAKAPVCEPNDHVPVQVINHMKEETPRQTHCQISRLDLSTNLSAVSLLAPPEVFDMGSKKELVHTMTTSVLGNRDEDKVQQLCDRSSHTKHSSGTRIRVLPGMSSSNKPWVAVNLTASTMQIKNNAP